MHIEFSFGSFFSVSGISKISKNISGFYHVADGKSFAVGIKMCIIQIGSMRTPYSDPVAAKFQPPHLFNGSVADTHCRKISGFIVRSHEVYSFMPSVSPIISCQVPGIFIGYGLSIRAIVSYRETFQIAEHRCIGIFPSCKNLFI